ncbi:uncharacterized protein LOC143364626 [Halictus rubicundus]|uniref:uncharacterized protein LOC143364626 n=1 Tax=Halictus rubicundus TaxID=77578 RepID=UPI004035C621
MQGIGNTGMLETESEKVSIKVKGKFETHSVQNVQTVRNLSLPAQTIEPGLLTSTPHLCDLRIESYSRAVPKILIGQDNWELIVTREIRSGRKQAPVASLTRLGWVIHGLQTSLKAINRHALLLDATNMDQISERVDDDLQELVRNYFKIDLQGTTACVGSSLHEKRAIEILEKTTRCVGAAWETGLLWRTDRTHLPNSRATALSRLKQLEARLDRDPAYAVLYYQEMERLIKNGYVKKTKKQDAGELIWYLPHFGVRNKNKPKKLRLVFDAAAKTKGLSLNDCLLAGPDLLRPLLGVLMRFRQRKVAYKADIEDMYFKIKIRREDQNAQRFLYRGASRETEPDEYIVTSLIPGAKSSPCSAIYVKSMNAKQYEKNMHLAVTALTKNCYMDDLIHCSATDKEASDVIAQIIKINRQGGFRMRGWASNSQCALAGVPPSERASDLVDLELAEDEGKPEKVLGLRWDTRMDLLKFNVGSSRVPDELLQFLRRPTKREFLRVIMAVFDPLGLLTPLTMLSKINMQCVWISGIGWDEPLGDHEFAEWKIWVNDLQKVATLSIPRHYVALQSKVTRIELHVFCDASVKAYAAVGYWRFQYSSGSIQTSLVAAKSRVAPLKPLSVPRLELQAAVLASRLAKTISEEHDFDISRRVLWSDSRTALLWIRDNPRSLQTFVAHRVTEINDMTNLTDWKWLPSDINPADDATMRAKKGLDESHRWFRGPDFLRLHESEWPEQVPLATKESSGMASAEKKKAFIYAALVQGALFLPDSSRFSSWKRLLSSTARVFVAAERWKRLRRKRETPDRSGITLTVEHLAKAERAWIKEIQRQSFPDEIAALTSGRTITVNSRIVQLLPMMDNYGLLRVQGRVEALANTDFQGKPVILDGKHSVTRLLLHNYHTDAKHGSENTVLNEVRQKFWVTNLRSALRSVVSKCQLCRLNRSQPRPPLMAGLPDSRLAYRERPFSHCGLDYFGPMLVTVGRRREKRWGALFTCLTTRGIHIELAHSLDTSSAIMALRRLAARRGQPRVIYSDNGTNFRGACNEMREAIRKLDVKAQQEYVRQNGTEWRFNPPAAPHMGGAWERLVRSVKTALNVVLRKQAPKEETLLTLLAEVEHTINSRPLTHVSLDPRDQEALTPNHFLIGCSSGRIAFERFHEQSTCPRKQWQIAQHLADCFWKRWLREYLPTLLPQKKWLKKTDGLKIGDVVLIADYQSSRNQWIKGVIKELLPGSDNQVRVIRIQTAGGSMLRPAIRLIKLTSTSEVQGVSTLYGGEDVPAAARP